MPAPRSHECFTKIAYDSKVLNRTSIPRIMRVSLEAQAMSGANYVENGYDIEEWERMESEVPAYLLAEEDEEKIEPNKIVHKCYFLSSENSEMEYHTCDNECDKVDQAQYEDQKAKC
ncbi:actin-binding FH2 protein [Striga asiatica]|uniref:Actin-binding FH2 protein n=1 Tax=Striga asiatica TaxID=4170 RepID=A0A5A7R700_STRAF|nr:actin-binding FH2 protein [Striga asiatica]